METKRFTKEEIEEAAKLIQSGNIVAFPTDTVYGLGADATNDEAVKKIFKAKGRPADRPISVLVSDPKAMDQYALEVPKAAKTLAEKFWPGPLTIILKNAQKFPKTVTGGKETIGLRMPDHPVALEFIAASGVPLATPSANSTGRPSPTKAEHVLEDLDGKISAVIDGGETSFGIESTVLDLSNPAHPVILRPGNISKEAIEETINQQVFSVEEKAQVASKAKHYEPSIPVYIVRSSFEKAIHEMTKQGEAIGLLASDEVIAEYKDSVAETFSLGISGDIKAANRNLFNGLRTLENTIATVVLVEPFEKGEDSFAFMNRLQSAANEKSI
ncbi:MAG TPA: L-threonylcarbamoyladenylate synthase [Atopostipes sp.]|nr:L-threonylcarbamoyladenylate synthase [Atopostipes sp.]